MAPNPGKFVSMEERKAMKFTTPTNVKGPSMIGNTVETEPTGYGIKGLAGRLLGFLGIPILFVLTSVFMTVFSFMSMKAEEGEPWGSLMNWWWSLMAQDLLNTMIVPLIVCIGILILFIRNKHGSS